jgi:flavin-dependent dehydrogenase
MPETITIVGGGLAGLSLGIGLRQRGVPVTVWEAGHYPRHRVCGEFISGDGQDTLSRLGLLDGLQNKGARIAVNAAFFTGMSMVAARPLPHAALCVSRFVLDQWLASEFQRLGGDLRLGTRWTGEFGPGIVHAGGRRPQPMVDGWRLFGLKVHARRIEMIADLEMHFVPAGYVGLCRLAGDEVNICGLFRSKSTVPDLAKHWRNWLGGPTDSVLRSRLANAQINEDSFCSVAGLCLQPRRAIHQSECCIGDSLTMIPPVTGNGMSMAFESAELAVEPLAAFNRGGLTWTQAQQSISRSCDLKFNTRLRWAACLQWALFNATARSALLFLTARSKLLWRGIFERTR